MDSDEARKMMAAQCPECGKEYIPDLPHGEGTAEQREQHLSGICSQACWDKHLGVTDKKGQPICIGCQERPAAYKGLLCHSCFVYCDSEEPERKRV